MSKKLNTQTGVPKRKDRGNGVGKKIVLKNWFKTVSQD
jgi:hypothetical protein